MRRPLGLGLVLVSLLGLVAVERAAAAEAWKTFKHDASGVSFAMPGDAEHTDKDGDAAYQLATDNNETYFQVFIRSGPEGFEANPQPVIDAFRDSFVKELNAKLLDEEAIKIGDLAGREYLLKMPDDVTLRQRCFPAGKWLVQQVVVIGPNSSVGPADVTKYFGSLTIAPPASPGGSTVAATDGWQTVNEDGFSFSMPEMPKRETIKRDTANTPNAEYLQYTLTFDNGGTMFAVYVHTAGAAANKVEGDKILENLTKGMRADTTYKILDVKPVTLGKLSGQEYLSMGDGTTIRQRAFVIGKYLIQIAAFTTDDSTVGPAVVNRFLNSLTLAPGGTVAPPGGISKPSASNHGAAPAGGQASFASFVEGLNHDDAKAVYNSMREDLQLLVDPLVLQVFFDVVSSELGRVTQATTDDFSSSADEKDGERIVTARGTVVFERGEAKVRTATNNGKLISFNIASPQLEPVGPKMYARVARALNAPQGEQFANALGLRCENFLEALFQKDEKAAYNELHPDIRAAVAFEKIKDRLASMRKIGPVDDVELITAGTQGKSPDALDEIHIGYELKRTNKPPAKAEFVLKFNGLTMMIDSFDVTEEQGSTDDDPVPPPKASTDDAPAPAAPPAPNPR